MTAAPSGPLRVLHLAGSATDELLAGLSRVYAGDCLYAVDDPTRYVPLLAYVSPDGTWRFPQGFDRRAIAQAPPVTLAEAVARLQHEALDVAVPQMYCLPGATHYRALLELLGIPYVGNRPSVMALAADKAATRAVVGAAGVDVPVGAVVGPGEPVPFPLPLVVKPIDSDNSVGVALVRDRSTYDAAVRAAATRSSTGTALVEAYVELGREVRVAVIERRDELVCLPLEEYAVGGRFAPVRGFGDKLRHGVDGELLAAKSPDRSWIVDVNDPVTASAWEIARTCHRALGCRHYSLFDLRVDPGGRPWFLEAGLWSSFASTSVITTMARAAGTDLADLFARALAEALAPAALATN